MKILSSKSSQVSQDMSGNVSIHFLVNLVQAEMLQMPVTKHLVSSHDTNTQTCAMLSIQPIDHVKVQLAYAFRIHCT